MIRGYHKAFLGLRAKPDDQDNLEEHLNRLDPSNHWHLEKVHTEGDRLLFVHQTADQQRLLLKYGQEMCLLDATHKTTRYSLPLFFMVVKTNVNYQVAGSFIVSMETEKCIEDALSVIKKWNPTWTPKFFMTDNCMAEITATEKVFPGELVLVSTKSLDAFSIIIMISAAFLLSS